MPFILLTSLIMLNVTHFNSTIIHSKNTVVALTDKDELDLASPSKHLSLSLSLSL